jgi:hypothetical protein
VEIVILGAFAPSAWTPEVIEQEFREWPGLPACCRRERISVRIPHDRAPSPHPDNLEWHQDGGGAAGTTQHMVVWASEQPTELRTSDGALFETPLGSVVWFDNTKACHRQPRGTDEARRWFVAIRCSGA